MALRSVGPRQRCRRECVPSERVFAFWGLLVLAMPLLGFGIRRRGNRLDRWRPGQLQLIAGEPATDRCLASSSQRGSATPCPGRLTGGQNVAVIVAVPGAPDWPARVMVAEPWMK